MAQRQAAKSDEWYTPAYAIEPIIPYLKKGSTVWCPFDLPESNYVKCLKENGFKVIHSHISEGKDFFKQEVPDCDYIVSNPPYSPPRFAVMCWPAWMCPFLVSWLPGVCSAPGAFSARCPSWAWAAFSCEVSVHGFMHRSLFFLPRRGIPNGSERFGTVRNGAGNRPDHSREVTHG